MPKRFPDGLPAKKHTKSPLGAGRVDGNWFGVSDGGARTTQTSKWCRLRDPLERPLNVRNNVWPSGKNPLSASS